MNEGDGREDTRGAHTWVYMLLDEEDASLAILSLPRTGEREREREREDKIWGG